MSGLRPSLEAGSVTVIGGLVPAPARAVPADVLRGMAGRVCGSPAHTVCGGDEPLGLFDAGRATFERSEAVWVVADMDLLNLEELHAVAGLEPGRPGLLPALYELEGPAFVRRLRGPFVLGLWDRRQHHLLLAVDHFGIRRLYYSTGPRGTAFASRLGAVVAAPEQSRVPDPAAIYDYLSFGYMPAPETAFQSVRRLSPGHLCVIRQGSSRIEPFWDMRYREEDHREGRAASRIYRLSHQAVGEAVRGLAPVRTGAFLSGGTDSSTVVGLMTRLTGEPVNAFSIGFHEDRYDELDYARLAARHFGAILHTRIVKPDDALAALPGLVDVYDEPLGNNSAIGTLFCAALAREHGVSRLLAGDGGDEIFGGNERYRVDQVFARYGRVPAPLRRALLEPVLLKLPADMPGILGRARRYIRRASIPNPRRFYSYEFHVAQNAAELLEPDFLRRVQADAPWQVLEEHFRRPEAASELNRLLYLDLKLTIGDNDLFKVTRTAELGSVGVRFPFLNLPLVEFMGMLPASFKVRGLEKRYLFKRAFRSLLPREILAKRKHGFGVPTAEWLRSHSGIRELARDTLLSARTEQRGYFRRGALEDLFARHDRETAPFYGDILWSVLMLELWHRRHVDAPGAAA
jgi:asparagine synthase (glutamine-hydrolysing)